MVCKPIRISPRSDGYVINASSLSVLLCASHLLKIASLIFLFFFRFLFVGLTYHDAIAESGVYEKAIERLPADLQEKRLVGFFFPLRWGHISLRCLPSL